MKAGLYARVSTNLQETENQLIELRRYATARAWETQEYVERGLSGALGEDKRPELKRLMVEARAHKLNAVIVWDFSRFARSMRHLVEALDNFRTWNIAFISLREGVDTTTANGRLMFGIFASLAEFERELIRERVNLGLARAKAQGKQLGRPRAQVDPEEVKLWVMGCAERPSLRTIASRFGVSRTWIMGALSEKPSQKTPQTAIDKAN